MILDAINDVVRIGVVSSVDNEKRLARVIFPALDNMLSDWLFVLQHNTAGVEVAPDNTHTHKITDTFSGGGSASTVPGHDHNGTRVTYWMPAISDKVLVLYIPVFNGDGFILGGF